MGNIYCQAKTKQTRALDGDDDLATRSDDRPGTRRIRPLRLQQHAYGGPIKQYCSIGSLQLAVAQAMGNRSTKIFKI
jgi:hypothetical protein